MASHWWLAVSRTERLNAECKLLHYMQGKPTLDAVRDLVLDLSALVQHQDVYGNHALHRAAHNGKAIPLMCALIKEGVDFKAHNFANQTPVEAAREAGHALQTTLLDRAADDKRKHDLKQQQQNSVLDDRVAVCVVHAVIMEVSMSIRSDQSRCSGRPRRHNCYLLLATFTCIRTVYVRLAFLTLTVTILPTLIAKIISCLRGDHEH